MKKTIFNKAVVAAIVSLTFTSMASAHHMSIDVNPNYDFVDDQISDMHIEVVDSLIEDDEMMGGMASSMGSASTTAGMETGMGSGMGSTSAPRTGSGRR